MSAGKSDLSDSSIQVLGKAVLVMNCFSIGTPVLSAAQVRQRTGLPATTCARILRSLVAQEMLQRDDDVYRVGLQVVSWSASATAGSRLMALAGPIVSALRDETLETAGVFVRNGALRVVVAVEESPRPILYRTQVGATLPLHVGAAGRVFMAFEPEARRRALAEGLAPFTERTVTTPAALDERLAQARQNGHAVARDEREPGLSSIAAPVRGSNGQLAAVIGLGLPTFRLTDQDEPRLTGAVATAAATLSRQLGYDATSST